jgi:hypothetical protein
VLPGGFQGNFPAAALDAIGHFFAREACAALGGGAWDPAARACACSTLASHWPRHGRETATEKAADSRAMESRYCLGEYTAPGSRLPRGVD